jgi:hypothetical protein
MIAKVGGPEKEILAVVLVSSRTKDLSFEANLDEKLSSQSPCSRAGEQLPHSQETGFGESPESAEWQPEHRFAIFASAHT